MTKYVSTEEQQYSNEQKTQRLSVRKEKEIGFTGVNPNIKKKRAQVFKKHLIMFLKLFLLQFMFGMALASHQAEALPNQGGQQNQGNNPPANPPLHNLTCFEMAMLFIIAAIAVAMINIIIVFSIVALFNCCCYKTAEIIALFTTVIETFFYTLFIIFINQDYLDKFLCLCFSLIFFFLNIIPLVNAFTNILWSEKNPTGNFFTGLVLVLNVIFHLSLGYFVYSELK